MDYIATLDTEVFFFFNRLHTPWLDPVMFYLSKTITSLPLYAVLIFLLFLKFNKTIWIPIVCIILLIASTDQLTSGLMKPTFERLRPSHEPLLKDQVHTVNGYKGGKFGFASSHASNTFGLAMFFFLLFRKSYRWMGLMFGWAMLVSYTRIYLGVHYPGDIIVGAGIGLICGWAFYRLNSLLFRKLLPEEKSNSPIF